MHKKAIIVGATGLVGKQLLEQLTSLYEEVIVIARSPLKQIDASMLIYQVIDFANLQEVMENIVIDEYTDAFTCLGTTKRQAGGKEGFRLVDYQYNLDFAKYCKTKGVKNFFLLSAMGADTESRFFYNRIKGELEQSIIKLKFSECFIFRPSLLLGKHKGRPLESFSQSVFKLMSPLVSEKSNLHPISAKRVASAIAMQANSNYEKHKYRDDGDTTNVRIVENTQLLSMTKKINKF